MRPLRAVPLPKVLRDLAKRGSSTELECASVLVESGAARDLLVPPLGPLVASHVAFANEVMAELQTGFLGGIATATKRPAYKIASADAVANSHEIKSSLLAHAPRMSRYPGRVGVGERHGRLDFGLRKRRP